jgi:peptide deformylase
MDSPLGNLLLLGDPRLYETCPEISDTEMSLVPVWVEQMHSVMQAVREKYGFGRAIAAPQLGIMKRLIYMNIDRPLVIINPKISSKSSEMIELWDDCMSFPQLLVRVERHKHIVLDYTDLKGQKQQLSISDSLSELIQHEYDHLDGILCTMRAKDSQSFKWRSI